MMSFSAKERVQNCAMMAAELCNIHAAGDDEEGIHFMKEAKIAFSYKSWYARVIILENFKLYFTQIYTEVASAKINFDTRSDNIKMPQMLARIIYILYTF